MDARTMGCRTPGTVTAAPIRTRSATWLIAQRWRSLVSKRSPIHTAPRPRARRCGPVERRGIAHRRDHVAAEGARRSRSPRGEEVLQRAEHRDGYVRERLVGDEVHAGSVLGQQLERAMRISMRPAARRGRSGRPCRSSVLDRVVAANVEAIRFEEVLGIAVGHARQHELRARRNRHAAELGVDRDRAPVAGPGRRTATPPRRHWGSATDPRPPRATGPGVRAGGAACCPSRSWWSRDRRGPSRRRCSRCRRSSPPPDARRDSGGCRW